MEQRDYRRLCHILDYCNKIETTVQRYGDNFSLFEEDLDYQQSISFSILQIGELSSGLSEEYKSATSDKMPWRAIKDMRNLVVHGYGSVDFSIVWQTVKNDIPALKQFTEEEIEKYSF